MISKYFMGDKTTEIITSIKEKLIQKPCSISDIADKAMDWRTAEYYLGMMKSLGLVKEVSMKNKRMFYYLDHNNYFCIPVKYEQSRIISSIYAKIREICLKTYNKEPTKTHVYKILWKINQELHLNLPVGWYMYGPICIQVYKGDEKYTKLDNKTIEAVKKATFEYCRYDNVELQRKVYDLEQEALYQIKEKILGMPDQNLNLVLMDLVKAVPHEAVETTTDFVRATLLLGWEKTRSLFDRIWKYIALLRLKISLISYYGEDISIYLDEEILNKQKEVQIIITDLVASHVKAKHSQEKRYQDWKRSRRNP